MVALALQFRKQKFGLAAIYNGGDLGLTLPTKLWVNQQANTDLSSFWTNDFITKRTSFANYWTIERR